MDRSFSTILRYEKIVSRLRDQHSKLTNDQDHLDAMIAKWISVEAESGKYKASTLRQYKAAMVYILEKENLDEHTLKILKEVKVPNRVKGTIPPSRTSAKKLKHISEDDVRLFLDEWLPASKSKRAMLLRSWFKASLITGLRPSEWEHARLSPNSEELIVRNGKATNGRAHGPERTHRLINLRPEDREYIIYLVRYLTKYFSCGGDFKKLLKSLSNTLYLESRKCWPKRKRHISLYTARHQFSANMKANGLGNREIAALMGHGSARTATIHYAKRHKGKKLEAYVMPREEEVARVKDDFVRYIPVKDSTAKVKAESSLTVAKSSRPKGP
jgi:integrase